jgi:predicted transposase YbfD/YdcC
MSRKYFESKFGQIEDKRFLPYVEHKLTDALILVMCGILSGLDELQDMILYGKNDAGFFRETFGIEKIPSKSTLTRIMNLVDGVVVAEIIVNIMRETLGVAGEVIAFDGKTIRATAKGNREKLHIMTAYITQSGVTVGHATVDEKTNEIPVMQKMLKQINLKNKVITADAMHCQKETAKLIKEGEGDYIFGIKGNQETLHDEVKLYLDDCIASCEIIETAQTKERNGGRIETRICHKSPSMDWYENLSDWHGLSCTFAIDRIMKTPAKTTTERCYYMSSLNVSADELLRLTREHWKIESMHYQLVVTFSEDECRVLSSNGQLTLNIFRKFALALHKNFVSKVKTKTKPSVKSSMFKALLSKDTLMEVLRSSFTIS